MSPRTGRPKVDLPRDIKFSIRLDEEENNRLAIYCLQNNVTRADAIRQAIHLLLKMHKEK